VRYRILSPALAELEQAATYYEEQQVGLGAAFIAEVDQAIRRILAHPEGWAQLSKRTRRCRTHRFPFGVIYQIRPDGILIVSVMHLKRHPGAWKSNLG
jgi:plasmid stabilization system protein ParE